MIIAVDFDGTCVDHRYPEVGPSVPDAIRVLKELALKRYDLILFTMRSGEKLDDAVEWFKRNNIPLAGINKSPNQHTWTSSPKAYANFYIDDAAFGCPLINVDGFRRMCVDWLEVEKVLVK